MDWVQVKASFPASCGLAQLSPTRGSTRARAPLGLPAWPLSHPEGLGSRLQGPGVRIATKHLAGDWPQAHHGPLGVGVAGMLLRASVPMRTVTCPSPLLHAHPALAVTAVMGFPQFSPRTW